MPVADRTRRPHPFALPCPYPSALPFIFECATGVRPLAACPVMDLAGAWYWPERNGGSIDG